MQALAGAEGARSAATSCSARRRCCGCAAATARSSSRRPTGRGALAARAAKAARRRGAGDAQGRACSARRRRRPAKPLNGIGDSVRPGPSDDAYTHAVSDEHGQIQDEELDAEREARRRLALAQIRQWPDPVLRLRAQRGRELRRRPAAARRADDGADGGRERRRARRERRSASLRRVFVFRKAEEDEPVAVVNPRIVDPSDERASDDEGCLSLQGVLVPVERHCSLTLEAQDVDGDAASVRARAGSTRGSSSTSSTTSTAC